MIEFTCACGKKYRVNDDNAGQRGTCKECGATIYVPRKEELRIYYEALVRDHFQNARDFFVDVIPEKELHRALTSYAKKMESTEKPVALFRQNFFTRLLRKGWLFTDWAVYYQNVTDRGMFRFIDVRGYEEKVRVAHTRGVSATSHKFLTVDVVLRNGQRHMFDASIVPFFQAITSITPGEPIPDKPATRMSRRQAKKLAIQRYSVLAVLVAGCIIGGLAGLLAGEVFEDRNAPYEAMFLIFSIVVLSGLIDRHKYTCGECGRRVAHSDHFCPQCKCVFQ